MTCGIWAWTEKGFFDDVAELTSIPLDPVVVILSIGFVMFILSFSGCLGALRENICLLKFVSTTPSKDHILVVSVLTKGG